MTQGSFTFLADTGGAIANTSGNVEALRELWLDRSLINGDDLGPGDEGDFDYGAWHVACHVIAAGGVRRAADGQLLWLEVSHDAAGDEYFGSVTEERDGAASTHRIDSAEGLSALAGSTLLGYVEGNSVGRVSAKGLVDPPDRFNRWQRQQFDQLPDSPQDGGKVWEHWCTVRDIRPEHRIGSSVLAAYVSLMSALDDRFVAAVARGRRSYGHPKQLCAMVRAGLTSAASAQWAVAPRRIPPRAERYFLEATPHDALVGAGLLDWSGPPAYYMFERRIGSWSNTDEVARDLERFGV